VLAGVIDVRGDGEARSVRFAHGFPPVVELDHFAGAFEQFVDVKGVFCLVE
jgi:hypothetical protein